MASYSQNRNQYPNSCLCDHCMNLQAMVYCQLHSSGLCLPCDFRLHNVDITSARHVRSFICDQCRSPITVMRSIDNMKSLCALCWEVEWKRNSQQAAVRMRSYSGCPTAAEFFKMLSVKSNTYNVEGGITIMDTLADNHSYKYNSLVQPESSTSLLASEGYGNERQRRLIQLPNASLDINSSNFIGPQLASTSLDINNNSNMRGSQYDYSSHLNAGGGTTSVQLGAFPHPSTVLTVGGYQYGMKPNFQNNQNSNCIGYRPENARSMPLSLSNFSEESSSMNIQPSKRKESLAKYMAKRKRRI